MAGLYAFVFGLGLVTISRRPDATLGGLGGMLVGLFCIYLSQVRSILVVAVIIAISYFVVLAFLRRYQEAVRVAVVAPAVALGAFAWAVALGGEATRQRFATLVESSPDEVYYKSRGKFLEETLTERLPDYPFGAGLGRWGMVMNYFGDPTNPNSTPIWVEIQWTGWVLDGGLPLVAAYTAALLAAGWVTGRVALRNPDPWVAGWAMLIVAYDVAAIAVTFNSTPFIGQSGVEFWLLNAAVFALDRSTRRRV
jgi:hypothetical protein